MRRVSTLPGTWLLMLLGVIPVLAAGVASAAPTYPVEDGSGAEYVVSYDPASSALTLSTPTVDGPDTDAGDGGVGAGGTTNDVSVSVVGPGGQVNHGQIVRHVPGLVERQQVGCIVRTVAQSDLGKGDQQIRPHDERLLSDVAEPVDPSVLEGECTTGSTGPAPSSAASEHGADSPRGKSSDAPGRNR